MCQHGVEAAAIPGFFSIRSFFTIVVVYPDFSAESQFSQGIFYIVSTNVVLVEEMLDALSQRPSFVMCVLHPCTLRKECFKSMLFLGIKGA